MKQIDLNTTNHMDFPMILSLEKPEKINLIISDIARNFLLDTLKYIKQYSEVNNVEVCIQDPENILA